jgi:hypothetical protein
MHVPFVHLYTIFCSDMLVILKLAYFLEEEKHTSNQCAVPFSVVFSICAMLVFLQLITVLVSSKRPTSFFCLCRLLSSLIYNFKNIDVET